MLGYVLRRIAATVPVMLVVAVLVFLMLRMTPGDPAAIIAGDNANAEQVAAIRARLGLDQPIATQFFGKPFTDLKILQIAYGYEQTTKRRKTPETTPPLAGEVFEYTAQAEKNTVAATQ